MILFKVDYILRSLSRSIADNTPFSHIRFGDGGLKFIRAFIRGDDKSLDKIVEKEGLPSSKLAEVFGLWGYYARRADFIDCPQVYYDGTFWPRVQRKHKNISRGTQKLLLGWKDFYRQAKFDNDRYCNPESNYLMIVDRTIIPNSYTLLNVMRQRRVCIISARKGLEDRFSDYDVTVHQIVAQYQDHYKACYKDTMKFIASMASNFDFWLVSAGELGRIYSGFIKECGGRTIDIGFVADFWCGKGLHSRLNQFMFRSKNPLLTELTEEGREYLHYM